MKRSFLMIAAVLVLVTASSCSPFESTEAYEARRRSRLLEMYPLRTTTRADVEKRFSHKPESTFQRPAKGWEAHENHLAAFYGARAEKRIGKKIPLADHYYGADGLFSLCYCWFYFDHRGHLLDTEWQWSSD
jgi:hypothetical protein